MSMDHSLSALFGSAFAAFFAIMNPIANTPIFLGLTEGFIGIHPFASC